MCCQPGDFFQNQQADFVAGIQKMARLRIVRGADDIAFQFVPQNLRVAALNPAGMACPTNGNV